MTTAAVTIHPATEADHPEIVDILVASYAEYRETFEQNERWEAYLKDIRESVVNPYLTQLWIAKIDDQIVGTVQLFETARKAYPDFELPIDYPFIRLLVLIQNGEVMGSPEYCSSNAWNLPRTWAKIRCIYIRAVRWSMPSVYMSVLDLQRMRNSAPRVTGVRRSATVMIPSGGVTANRDQRN